MQTMRSKINVSFIHLKETKDNYKVGKSKFPIQLALLKQASGLLMIPMITHLTSLEMPCSRLTLI